MLKKILLTSFCVYFCQEKLAMADPIGFNGAITYVQRVKKENKFVYDNIIFLNGSNNYTDTYNVYSHDHPIKHLRMSIDSKELIFQNDDDNRSFYRIKTDFSMPSPLQIQLIHEIWSPIWSLKAPYNKVYYLSKTGTATPRIYSFTIGPDTHSEYSSAPSTTGSNIASIQLTSDEIIVYDQNDKIQRIDHDGKTPKNINQNGEFPRISQNAISTLGTDPIVYSSQKDQAKGEIYISNFSSIAETKLTDNNFKDFSPAISPDKHKIVFVSDRDGSNDIFIMNIDGSNPINITKSPDIDEFLPDWTNDKLPLHISNPPPTTTNPNWPNFEKTWTTALMLDAYQFVALPQYKGPNWDVDYCTKSPDTPLGLNFKHACAQHDFAYRNLNRYIRGRNEYVRSHIENHFYDNLRLICKKEHKNPASYLSCLSMANTFYEAVSIAGIHYYYNNNEPNFP